MFDTGTILISTALSHLTVAFMLFLLWRKNRFDGLRWWVGLFFVQGLSILLMFLRPAVPAVLSVVLANVLVVASMHFLLLGLSRFFNRPVPKKISIIALLILLSTILLYIQFTFITEDLRCRIISSSTMQAGMLLLCWFFIAFHLPTELRKKAKALKWLLVGIIAFILARMMWTLFGTEVVTFPLSFHPTSFFLMVNEILSVLLAINFVLLINNRLLENLKAANADTAASEFKYRSLVENSPNGICIVNSSFVIIYANPKIAAVMGFSPPEVEGKDFRIFMAPHSLDQVLEYYKRRQAGDKNVPSQYEADIIDADGNIRTMEFYSVVFSLEEDSRYTLVQSVDVTERINMVRELKNHRAHLEDLVRKKTREVIQAEKLSSLGTIAAGLAHEINNPNNYIRLNADLLKKGLDVVAEILQGYELPEKTMVAQMPLSVFLADAPEMAGDIIDGSTRIQDIIRSLKEYAYPDSADSELTVLDLNLAVENSLVLAGKYIKEFTDCFELHLSETPLYSRCNEGKIEHVIINLLQNSANALTHKQQKISISTSSNGEWNKIVVKDEGRGIAQENIDKIFDPFFTTRRAQGGSGLGLSVAQRLVEELKGTISAESKQGQGTVITVSLPAVYDKIEVEVVDG